MNDVYFACVTCHTYIDAGYRWCYWTLEHPGIVTRRMTVDVAAVQQVTHYWTGSDHPWLQDRLGHIQQFFAQHGTHQVIYGQGEDVGIVPMSDSDLRFLDWVNVEERPIDFVPRDFVERLGFASWSQVDTYVVTNSTKPWWWQQPEFHEQARATFYHLVHVQASQNT